ncbi:hypothetical protein ABWH97_06620 [Nitratireductor sp. ac15]
MVAAVKTRLSNDSEEAGNREAAVVIGEDATKLIEQAIAHGQVLIGQGRAMGDASMAIYRVVNTQPQETVVSVMIEGAGLTPKGALTY